MNFDITDRINICLDVSDEYKEDIKDYLDMSKEETLTINLYNKENISDKIFINEYEVRMELEVVSE